MKLIITLTVVFGLGAGGYYFWKNNAIKPSETENGGRPTIAVVEPRSIRFEVSAAGDIGPADQVSVRPEVNGRIEELPVDIGDQVKKGDLLCRLDDRDLQIERRSRLAEIDGAKLQVERANRNFRRSGQLYAQALVSQEVFEDSKTEYELATNSLDRAVQQLNLVEDRLRKTRIQAPFDCTVLTRPVSLGQTVSGAAGFNSGTEIMTIANLKEMVVNAHVNQADVIRLQQGREVEIQAESVPGVKMRGIVERIAPQAVIKNGIKGFSARISIQDIDPRVRPGMTAILSIPVSSADNVLSVPLAAVFTEEGERFVFVKNENQFERRPIVLGVTDYSYAEVVHGLSAGEVVSLEQQIDSSPPKPAGANVAGEGRSGERRKRPENSGVSSNTGSRRESGRPGGSSGSRRGNRAAGS